MGEKFLKTSGKCVKILAEKFLLCQDDRKGFLASHNGLDSVVGSMLAHKL